MAPPPTMDLPGWATWASLAALACIAALAVVASRLGPGRAGAGAGPAEDARMGLWGHVGELRRRLVHMVLGVCAGVAVAFTVRFTSAAPYVLVDAYDNLAAQVFRRLVRDLVPADVRLIVTHPTDGFVALFYVAFIVGFLVALPYVIGQIVLFLRPALRPRERLVAMRLVVPATLLFALGVAFAYAVVLPRTFDALYAFSDVLAAENLLDARGFVAFTLMFLLLTGAGFQLPLVMYGLARVGLATPQGMLRKWRHALLAIVVVAAFVTPDPSPVSQILLSVPLFGLYMLGAGLAWPASRALDRSARGHARAPG